MRRKKPLQRGLNETAPGEKIHDTAQPTQALKMFEAGRVFFFFFFSWFFGLFVFVFWFLGLFGLCFGLFFGLFVFVFWFLGLFGLFFGLFVFVFWFFGLFGLFWFSGFLASFFVAVATKGGPPTGDLIFVGEHIVCVPCLFAAV